jgi:predicted AlkP superfamily pyrophosphatase or phosphodiesterase
MRHLTAALILGVTAGACAGGARPALAPKADPPKLIVQLMLDQLRADYPDRYGATWTKGLHRLTAEGAWFTEARYPYAVTVTCAGHSTVGTGTTPSVHGMVLNAWWDRDAGRRVECADDPSGKTIGLLRDAEGDIGPSHMLVPTLAEQLAASQPAGAARVVTMSLKPRSAIGLAGHHGDAVLWFDGNTFATSSAFTTPSWLVPYLEAHPIEQSVNAEWTRAMPATAYKGADDGIGESAPRGWTTSFPHAIGSTSGTADSEFYSRWQRSPLSDAYLADMAIAAVDALHLGQRDATDYLGVSFSALDLVGHSFGPDSHEVQDVLFRADEAIGRLLDHLDATVGPANYVVALTGDHGVAQVPEAASALGIDAGRVRGSGVREAIEAELDAAWGDDAQVIDMVGTDVYLSVAARDRLAADAAARARLKTRIEAIPGVQTMVVAAELARSASSDPVMQALRLSYYPGRSGDLLLLLDEHYITASSGTTHGTFYDYDRRVPVILFGTRFKAGRYDEAASPLDIAATWARLAGVSLTHAAGRVHDAAFK